MKTSILKSSACLFVLCLLFGCEKETDDFNKKDEVDEKESTHMDVYREKQPIGDDTYSFLGCGYDVTGEYFTPYDVKAQIIDPKAFCKDHLNRFKFDTSNGAAPMLTTGETASDYLKQLGAFNEYGIEEDLGIGNTAIFGGSLKKSFNENGKFSDKYSYSSYNMLFREAGMYFNADTEMLSGYLSDEFKEDVQNLSAKSLIEKYGTHALTEITLGFRLEINYRCSNINSLAGIAACGIYIFGLPYYQIQNALLHQKLNTDQSLRYQTFGGAEDQALSGMINLEPGKFIPVNISAWRKSWTPQNRQIIGSRIERLIPLYSFVENSTKKAEVKIALKNYLKEKEVVLE